MLFNGRYEDWLLCRWEHVRLLPGAERLIEHLHRHGVPLAIATRSSRESFDLKMASHSGLLSRFQETVCGDEAVEGEPHPDIYLAAARKLGLQPEECLALEHAPSGIMVRGTVYQQYIFQN